MKNLFEKLQEQKEAIQQLILKAKSFGWIDKSQANEIMQKIDADKLTFGVVGQMKCGKSTFLNAFVFEEDILPSATTPMTSALSVITYGPEKKIEVEFYTKDEWGELVIQSQRSLEEVLGNKIEESKIKAAKELVKQAQSISNLSELLGQKRNDSLENLIEYVGANGKYVAITKSTTIFYPKEYLKNVEIVDTPGFNDPIVSREERTKEFLRSADVVLMMLYAGRAFDSTDRDIVFEQIRSVGVGKLLVAINKYDLIYESGETVEDICNEAEKEIRKATSDYKDPIFNELFDNLKTYPLSANMALMSALAMDKIVKNPELSFQWNRICDIFEISSQKEMFEKSLIENLSNAVLEVIQKNKVNILFKKQYNHIFAIGNKNKQDLDIELIKNEVLIKALNTPDKVLEEKLDQILRSERKLNRSLRKFNIDLRDELNKITRTVSRRLEDAVEEARNQSLKIVDDEPRRSIENRLRRHIESFDRNLKRMQEDSSDEVGSVISYISKEFLYEVEDILRKYVDDFDGDDIIISIRESISNIVLDHKNIDLLISEDENSYSFVYFLSRFIFPTIFFYDYAYDFLSLKNNLRNKINSMFNKFNLLPFKENVSTLGERLYNHTSHILNSELLEPILKIYSDILSNKENKESQLIEANKQNIKLKEKISTIKKEITEITLLIESIS